MDIDSNFKECIFCEIELTHKEKLLLGAVYRSGSSDNENFKNLQKLFNYVECSKAKHKVMFGDLNFPGINWESKTTSGGTDDIEYKFIETVRDTYFHQQ
jgi:hypothetical protein